MKFQTEKPLTDFQIDKFSYKNLSKSILDNFLLEMELPNCFGLYGNWGSGKSSLMHFMIKHIADSPENYKDIKTIYFEPWKYEYSNEKDLLFALLNCIKKNSGLTKNQWKTILVDALVIGSGLMRNLKGFDPTGTVGDFKTFENIIFKEHEIWIDKIEEFKVSFSEIINQVLEKSGASKLLIFIDDLDRCLPENTVKLLEGIKNFLSVEKTLFILALDKRVVTEMIEKKYGLHYGYGEEYIMKIIHYYYDLPKIDIKEIIKDILKIHNLQAEESQYLYMAQFLQKFGGEPRIAKYILHQFCMKIILSPQAQNMIANDGNKTMLLYLFVAAFLLTKFPKLFLGSSIKYHLDNIRASVAVLINPSRSPDQQYESIIQKDSVIDLNDRKQLEAIFKTPINNGRESSPSPIMDVEQLYSALLTIQVI